MTTATLNTEPIEVHNVVQHPFGRKVLPRAVMPLPPD